MNNSVLIFFQDRAFPTTSVKQPGDRMTVLLDQPDVRVAYGANNGVFSIVGGTVASVRRSLATAFNIPAEALINGVQVDHDHSLRPCDYLEFTRRWGLRLTK